MVIRQAVAQDVPELARLRWEFLKQEASQSGATFEDFLADFKAFWQSSVVSAHWTVWVGEGDGGLIGNMWLHHIEKVPHPGQPRARYGYLTNVYVDPRYQGSGLGTELLRVLVDWARSCEMEFLIVWPSRRSVPFYERAGFQVTGEAFELQLNP